MITCQDLKDRGFEVIKEYPLFFSMQHRKNNLLFASVGTGYGEIFIGEKHWCNDDYERTFSTINHKLTANDFDSIISMLNITL